jgi:integrase
MNAPFAWPKALIRTCVMEGKSMKGLKFTKANLDELKPAEKEYFAWSQDLPGFGIRVLPSGKRSWLVQFRDGRGVSCRRTIGDCRVVPLTLAEIRAQQLLAQARVYGVDLVTQERLDARARLLAKNRTLGAVIGAYLSESEVRAKRSYAEIKRYLEVVWQDVHHLDAEEISRHDLVPTLRRIATERGGPTANRARATLSGCIVWAIRHGVLRRDSNPCSFLPSWDEKPRERALSLEELGLIWQAAPQVNETFGAMIRMLILTGCRRSEIADLEWSEIDFARAVIELPSSRTKNGLPHTVPLAPCAVAILAGAPRLSDSRVFVNFRAWSWAKIKLDHLVKLPAWVVHDIRRSVSTGLREHLSADVHLIELILNHQSGTRGAIAGVYDRSQRLAERRDLLERWATLITEAAGEPVPAIAANVVPIGRAGR